MTGVTAMTLRMSMSISVPIHHSNNAIHKANTDPNPKTEETSVQGDIFLEVILSIYSLDINSIFHLVQYWLVRRYQGYINNGSHPVLT